MWKSLTVYSILTILLLYTRKCWYSKYIGHYIPVLACMFLGLWSPPFSIRKDGHARAELHKTRHTHTQTYKHTPKLGCRCMCVSETESMCVCVSAPKNFFGCQSMEAEKQRARVTHTHTDGAVTTVTARHPV